MLSISTDNASTMISTMNKFNLYIQNKYKNNFYHVRCASHVLNLVVQVAFESTELSDAISAVRTVCKSIRNSSKLIHQLRVLAKLNDEKCLKVILDCSTRWNSTYDMLQVAVGLEDSLTLLSLQSDSLQPLTNKDWDSCKLALNILAPFKKGTDELGGDDYLVASFVYCAFSAIKEKLTEFEKAAKYIRFKATIQEMAKKFDTYWQIMKPLSVILCGLDPRMKASVLQKSDKTDFTESVGLIYDKYQVNNNNNNKNNNENDEEKQKKESSFMELLLIKRKVMSTAEEEIDNYIQSPPCSHKTNVENWWRENSTLYPVLSLIAKDYLSISPTSTPSERAFSLSQQIVTEERSSLNEEKVGKLVQLCAWGKLRFLN